MDWILGVVNGLSSVMFSILLFISLLLNIFGLLGIMKNGANLELVTIGSRINGPNVINLVNLDNIKFILKFAVCCRNIAMIYIAVCLFSFINLLFGTNIGVIINFRIFIIGLILAVLEGIIGFSLGRQYKKILKLKKGNRR